MGMAAADLPTDLERRSLLPGVNRSFTSFSGAAEEATLSRIFAGVHFLFDLTSGRRLGSDVADFVLDNFLTSRDRDD